MKTEKSAIMVEQFHYDLLLEPKEPVTDINVSLNEVEATGDQADEIMAAGHAFQFVVDFHVVLDQFEITGRITRIIQFLDYFDAAEQLPTDVIQKLARPLVEYIETITYRVTEITLDQGIQLSFEPASDDSENQ